MGDVAQGRVELLLETTSTCNASCVFCPYTKLGRAGGLMSMDLFEKIIDEAATIPIIHRYVLHGLGEPLLDPHLTKRVEYIRERTDAKIRIYTNGVYLGRERFHALKNAGVSSFIFSLNATTPEQHERLMGLSGKFDTVCENARYAIDNQGHVDVQVHAVARDFTPEDVERFVAMWGTLSAGGAGVCITEGNWAGDNKTQQEWDPNSACRFALAQMAVMYDGRVKACCMDPSGKLVFGDLNRQTLREVYNGKKYLDFRIAHSENRAAKYKVCAECSRG